MADSDLPPRFQEIKSHIASSVPNFEERVTKAWVDLIAELNKTTEIIGREGSSYIVTVKYDELKSLSSERIAEIKKKGSVIIQDVVDDEVVKKWKTELQEFVKANPGVIGTPVNDKQFFHLYWTKQQLEARSHPNVLGAGAWLNNLYTTGDSKPVDGVDLSYSLTYADRFRIRHPSEEPWVAHPPHVDGGGIERWEDDNFRKVFKDILNGEWRNHDPYNLSDRLNANASLYGRRGQATIFRTFQGWLAMTEISPHNGTLQVFPDIRLSNAYTILRPFFSLKTGIDPKSEDVYLAENWKYDISTNAFPGIFRREEGFYGPRPRPESHPHLRLERSMTSIPTVKPGDMVFWHCDVVHAVEQDHIGTDDSAVMYIPAVPLTPQNAAYVFGNQLESFRNRETPGDYSGQGSSRNSEKEFAGVGKEEDVLGELGKRAMGFIKVGA